MNRLKMIELANLYASLALAYHQAGDMQMSREFTIKVKRLDSFLICNK